MYYIFITIIVIITIILLDYCFSPNLHKFWYPKYYNNITFKDDQIDTSRVELGRERAKNQSIVICGLARNNYDVLVKNIPKIDAMGSLFNRYKVVVFENDSADATRQLLKQWESAVVLECPEEPNCKLKQRLMYDLGTLSKSRIDKMSDYRNRYLEYVKQNYSDYDYMLVIDLDFEGSISFDGLLHSLSFDNWDGICINGRCPFPGTFGAATMAYDSLAYQPLGDNTDYKIDQKTLDSKLYLLNNLLFNLYTLNKDILTNNELIPVNSAFNGCAIYKMDSIRKARYSNYASCEHIGFHRSIGGKIYINPYWKGYSGYQGPRNIFAI